MVWTKAVPVVTSLSTVALYLAYIIPVALGLRARRAGSDWPTAAVWSLGRFGPAINMVAIAFAVFICFVLVMPPNQLAGETLAGLLLGSGRCCTRSSRAAGTRGPSGAITKPPCENRTYECERCARSENLVPAASSTSSRIHNIKRVKLGAFDIDSTLRGKYVSTEKFLVRRAIRLELLRRDLRLGYWRRAVRQRQVHRLAHRLSGCQLPHRPRHLPPDSLGAGDGVLPDGFRGPRRQAACRSPRARCSSAS